MAEKTGSSIESLTRGRVSFVRITGTVDDDFSPNALVEAIKGSDAIISLEELERMSADGARAWGEAMESLSKKLDRIVLVKCSRAVVTELNLSPSFAGGVVVASAQVRHVCRKCNSVARVTYDVGRDEIYGRRGISTTCQRCSGAMTVDEKLETYLAFRQHQSTLDAALAEAVDTFPETLGKSRPLPTDSELRATHEPDQRGLLSSRRAVLVLAGGAAAVLLAGGIVALVVAGSSADEELALLAEHIRTGRLEQAEVVLSQLEANGDISQAVVTKQRRQIEAARALVLQQTRDRILEAFQEGKYDEIIALSPKLNQTELSDPHVAFVVAESYRHTRRLSEAAPYYLVVLEAADPGPFLDDALFWRAEALLLQDNVEEATKLFERVLEIRRSNFAKSAKRRLATIRDK